MTVPAEVRIVEVGPRDGLQNEAVALTVEQRVKFIELLLGAGCRTIEVGSFVSPRWVPQMAGTDRVLAALGQRPEIRFPVLVPNERGLSAAISSGATEVAVFASASEAFSLRNINCTVAQSIERFRPVAERALAVGVRLRGYLSCVLGCPYEGAVHEGAVVRLVASLRDLGCCEISLGDTIGVGTPGRARHLIRAVGNAMPVQDVAVHFHDTYGQALANIHACLDEGVRVVDSSAGGLGGCPYAAGASGNVATEDVVYMLDGLGLRTGIELEKLAAAGRFATAALGRGPQSKTAMALAARCGDADPQCH